jgi:hypothetical protein
MVGRHDFQPAEGVVVVAYYSRLMTRFATAAIACLPVVALVACGDDDDDTAGEGYIPDYADGGLFDTGASTDTGSSTTTDGGGTTGDTTEPTTDSASDTDTTGGNTETDGATNTDSDETGDGTTGETEEMVERRYTYRAIGGVSMGGIAGINIGFRYHDKLDFITSNGGYADFFYFLDMFRRQQIGGFSECRSTDVDQRIAELIANPDGDCGNQPGQYQFEHPNSFNRWFFQDSGGSFDRDSYIELLQDISLAMGNPFYYNPESPYLPPGLTQDFLKKTPAEKCVNPAKVDGLINLEFNPTGAFQAITFCDGETGNERDPSTLGVYDPTKPHNRPVDIALAVDYNGNGIRDFGEPIAYNYRERFSDVGCSAQDAPAGATTGTYDYLTNPTGTAKNWVWDDCEPFDDNGLDGVPNTGDYGEGNGRFDYAPGYINWLVHTPRTYASLYLASRVKAAYDALDADDKKRVFFGSAPITGMTDADLARVDVILDGGIRDMFNAATTVSQLFGTLETRDPRSQIYDNFTAAGATQVKTDEFGKFGDPFPPLVPNTNENSYTFDKVDWGTKGKNAGIRYGNWDASQGDIDNQDGMHVGTASQAIFRFDTTFAFVSARWPNGNWAKAKQDFSTVKIDDKFFSKALKAERSFVISLPPGYNDPANASVRYPVMIYMHGYGQEPGDLAATGLIYNTRMSSGQMQKFIIAYADGQCCFSNPDTDEVDCIGDKPHPAPWKRECNRGSFYVDAADRTNTPGRGYEQSIFELFEYIDSKYRTKQAETVMVPKSLGTVPDQRIANGGVVKK